MRRPLALLTSAALLAAVAASCGDSSPKRSAESPDPPVVDLDVRLAASLETFGGCEELLGYYRDRTIEMAGSGGMYFVGGGDRRAVAVDGDAVAAPVARGAAEMGSGGASAGGAGGGDEAPAGVIAPLEAGKDYSTTNIQEKSVDEPDLVKADGERIVLVDGYGGDRLSVVRAGGGAPEVVGSVKLPESGGHEIFLSGDRVLVLTRSWEAVPLPAAEGGASAGDTAVASSMYVGGGARTVATAVDISGEGDPRIVEHRAFEGELVSARLHDGRVRVVLRSQPYVPYMDVPVDIDRQTGEPEVQGEPQDDPRAAFEEAVRSTELDAFLPGMSEAGGAGAEPAPTTEPLVECDDVSRPPEPSGSGTVTVLTLDADGAVEPLDTVAVVADAQTVYASTETLYVATNEWVPPPAEEQTSGRWKSRRKADVASERYTTALHAFDISDGDGTGYLGSGRVTGQLLNQWSLSEHEGFLRVATTEGSPWVEPGVDGEEGGAPQSESFLTVLERQGDKLVTKGQVGGLGPNETIQSVRFTGDTAYVVTFRQTDPLYVLDLADPAAPRVLGELKVTGFSSYLHPVADDRLVGVGQSADDEGRTQGLQVSLFDVADPAKPSLVDRESVRNGYSNAEHDHRAFLWWGASEVAVVPASAWTEVAGSEGGAGENFSGAIVYRITRSSVEEKGRITQTGHLPEAGQASGQTSEGEGAVAPDFVGVAPEIMRSVVVGDTLYTVSPLGVMASDLDSLEETGWALLPR